MSIWSKRKKDESVKVEINYVNYEVDEKEFWSLVDVKDVNECWLWKGSYTSGGYGYFRKGLAHKVSYVIKYGKFPKNKKEFMICHKCNNSKCVNPNHLYIGSPKDNMNDIRITNRINKNLKGKTNKLILSWINKNNKQEINNENNI